MPTRWSVAAMLLVVAFAALPGCKKKDPGADGPPPPLGEPDYRLTAAEFGAEFDKDAGASEAKYQGKVVELSGKVMMSSRDEDDGSHGLVGLSFEKKEKLFPACACLFEDRNIAEQVGKAQTVRIKGQFLRHFVFPSLNRCVIVEKGPETLVRITAEQLAKEHTADPGACEKKYDKSTLLISGVISAVKTDENNVKFVELRGDGKTVIEVRYIAWGGKWPIEYKVGDRARLTAEILSLRTTESLIVVVMDVALDNE